MGETIRLNRIDNELDDSGLHRPYRFQQTLAESKPHTRLVTKVFCTKHELHECYEFPVGTG